MSTIGFVFASDDEFRDTMLRLVGEAREYHVCPAGEYAIWRSRTGAEIWFHIEGADAADSSERTIAGLTPFYEGGRATALDVTGVVRRPGDNPFEGAFQGEVGGDGEGDSGFPLIFDAVNFAACCDLDLPARWRVRLTGFARELKAFPSEDAYYAAQTSEPAFAARSFIPIGMFSGAGDDGADREPPSSHAALSGQVVEARLLENEATGRRFHWLSVASLEMTIDIVADPEVVSGDVAVGSTVEAICLLLGRIMVEPRS